MTRRNGAAAALLLGACLAHPAATAAQAGRSQVQEGNRLYGEGRFDEAHQRYLEGLAEAPGSPLIRFNDGNALYQSQEYQQALEAYRQAIESGDRGLAGAAWYNLGNALYRSQQLQQSLEAYKQALRMNPNDADAKHNLERVLEQLQQQQQQQQQSGGQGQNQGEEDRQPDQNQQSDQNRQAGQDRQQGQDRRQPDQAPEGQGQQQPAGEPDQEPAEADQGDAQGQQGQMTPEEARRLLDALDEDPDAVDRQRAPARERRPGKPW